MKFYYGWMLYSKPLLRKNNKVIAYSKKKSDAVASTRVRHITESDTINFEMCATAPTEPLTKANYLRNLDKWAESFQ